MVLTLMHARSHDVPGVSRQGGSGIGGGIAAGRHRATGTARTAPPGPALSCVSCTGPVTGVAVVVQSRVYCSWDCAVTSAGIPGRYLG